VSAVQDDVYYDRREKILEKRSELKKKKYLKEKNAMVKSWKCGRDHFLI
jgi:hypothetical protein